MVTGPLPKAPPGFFTPLSLMLRLPCTIAATPHRSQVARVLIRPILGTYLRRLQRHGVHAVSSADVPGVEPVHLEVACRGVLPAEEVGVQDSSRVPVR